MAKRLSDRGRASVLLYVAARTIQEARIAWAAARVVPEEGLLQSAYLACVTASRATHIAAQAWSADSRGHRLAVQAKRIDAIAADLLVRLTHAAIAT